MRPSRLSYATVTSVLTHLATRAHPGQPVTLTPLEHAALTRALHALRLTSALEDHAAERIAAALPDQPGRAGHARPGRVRPCARCGWVRPHHAHGLCASCAVATWRAQHAHGQEQGEGVDG